MMVQRTQTFVTFKTLRGTQVQRTETFLQHK
jgi:hypothetical protein